MRATPHTATIQSGTLPCALPWMSAVDGLVDLQHSRLSQQHEGLRRVRRRDDFSSELTCKEALECSSATGSKPAFHGPAGLATPCR